MNGSCRFNKMPSRADALTRSSRSSTPVRRRRLISVIAVCCAASMALSAVLAHGEAKLAHERKQADRRPAAAEPDPTLVFDQDAPVFLDEEPRPGTSQLPSHPPALPTVGGDIWVAEGPGPTNNGQVENVIPDNQVVGAVHVVTAHPSNADILYIGAVNGGVWKTTNATAANPNWTPLTDAFSSLSIGALVLDPTDAASQTLWAGIGRFSSFGRAGGQRTGLLRTADGGSNWAVVDGGGLLVDKNISGIAARGSTVVVSVDFAVPFSIPNIGIFRSVDGGSSFTQISTGNGGATGLPGGLSHDLTGDPTDLDTLYAPILFAGLVGGVNGVYKSTDAGATWTKVSNAAMDAVIVDNETSNVEIAVGNVGQIYVAILCFGQLRNGGIFRSGNGGATWQTMDIPLTNETGGTVGTNPRFKPDAGIPGGQGAIHFSIIADPVDSNVVYVGGDRQPAGFDDLFGFPNAIGANDFSGRLFRGDASQVPGSQWVHLTHSSVLGPAGGGTAGISAPHADSREMAFDANGDLIEVDDGGAYRRTSPRDNSGDWFSIIGDLQTTELHDVAYDSVSNVIIGGAQDTGTPQQIVTGGTTWDSVSTADGGDVLVDDTTLPGFSIRYSSFQFLILFRRITHDANNAFVAIDFPNLTVIGGGAPFEPQFSTPMALSAVDQTRLVIGGANSVYESLDQGDTISEIGPGIVVTNTTVGQAIAYGGRISGVPNPDVLYLGTFNGEVFVRTTAGGLLAQTLPPGGTFIRDVVMNSDNWMEAFAIDFDQVFHTTNAGGLWGDITGNLTGVGLHRSLEFIPGVTDSAVVVGTDRGVFVSLLSNLSTWNKLGTNLPHAPVFDMEYDEVDDIFVAGTLGRGAWTLTDPLAFSCGVGNCNDNDACTFDQCLEGECSNTPSEYGDINHDGKVDLFDLFCILNGFSNDFSVCSFKDDDLDPCAGDGDIDLFDLFAVLNAFSGDDPCCGG